MKNKKAIPIELQINDFATAIIKRADEVESKLSKRELLGYEVRAALKAMYLIGKAIGEASDLNEST